nr:hypothetical protein [Rhodoferax sp.]
MKILPSAMLLCCLTQQLGWSAEVSPLTTLVPDDAKEIQQHMDGAREQISFVLTKKYPQEAISQKSLSTLISKGWIRCTPNLENRWVSFKDVSRPQDTRVFQRLYFLKRDEEFITISMQYVDSQASVTDGQRPLTDLQIVRIVKVAIPSAVQESIVESNGAKCAPLN